MDILKNLDWLIYGIIIGLFVPVTLLIGNKQFGVSSVLQNLCSSLIPKTKFVFKNYDFKKHEWKIYFVIGIVFGGFLATNIVESSTVLLLPNYYYSYEGIWILFIGGLLVGFGARYAGGCTSGHSITGLSMLQLSSLVATISFFIGGLIYTYLF